MYQARAPAGVDVGTPSGMVPMARGDIKWGSFPLNVLQHPTPLLVGTAFVIVIALQDISMSAGLITGLVLTLFEAALTTSLYATGRLKHYSYSLNHCFLWPLLTWVVVMWFDFPKFHHWMNVAVWGGVTTLMSITMLLGYPWARDLLKDKTPATTWETPWWDDLATYITRVWVLIFTCITASALVPFLTHKTGAVDALNIIFNYIMPILLCALGIALTQGLIEKTKETHLDAASGMSAASSGAAGVYEPLVSSTTPAV